MLVPDIKSQSGSWDGPYLVLTSAFGATDRDAADSMATPGATTSGFMRPRELVVDLVGPLLLNVAVLVIPVYTGPSAL